MFDTSIDYLNSLVYNTIQDGSASTRTLSNSCSYVEPGNFDKINGNFLSIICSNIRSMNRNFDNFKTEILESFHYDIIGLCETRLTDETVNLYKINNYHFTL